MKPYLTLLLLFYSVDLLAECGVTPHILKASYTITTTLNNEVVKQTHLNLWRQNNTVAHQYPDTNITESFFHTRNQKVKPTRYFDAHQRGIEYQPNESVQGKTETDWHYRNQLISNTLLEKMELTGKQQRDCETLKFFELKQQNAHYKLEWLDSSNLIQSFVISGNNYQQKWTLSALSFDNQKVASFFNKRLNYQTTDYADIGDDHTDPFLTEMVALGFIEHGASGFYNEQGEPLNGQHHSH